MVQNEKMRRMLPFLLWTLLLPPGPAPAQDRHRHRHLDHDSARAAVMEGRVLPLAEILAMVQPRLEARIIEVELEEHDGVLIYELRAVTPQGRLLELEVDAATGRILKGGG